MPERFQESFIRQVPLFQPLTQAQIEVVAQSFQMRRYNPGEFIFQQGAPTTGMHIFVQGQAVLLRTTREGHRQSVGIVREGQYVNQNALFQEGSETATLQAVQPVTALFLSREAMANLLAYHVDISEALGMKPRSPRQAKEARFKAQRPNEHIVLMTRRHWWAYIRWLWVPLLLLLPFIALIYALPMLNVAWIPLLFVIPGLAAVYLYLEWANDSVIITDQRVIRITHTILTFTEVRDEIALASIQEANADLPRFDPFALLLGYGNVQLKTAGREGNFMLTFMPDPEGIQELILEDLRTQNLRGQVRERQALRADLDKWIGTGTGDAEKMSKGKLG
ncbi:MAG: cyclic nucleotide-binding domain-containing protein, partial [Anaerolineae bacterium]|nr:cyclic nucleotide-binding domain-containing protein [Anaerolineae bacterium]